MGQGDLVVVKLGTSTLVDEAGSLDQSFIDSLCSQVCDLRHEGYRVIVVSSGAAAAGRELLGFDRRPTDIPTLQACAATGQPALTKAWADGFARCGTVAAQVLLTRRDVVDRDAYLNARNTLERLLDLDVVPVVNENDTVSVAEFAFGDNDMLGAIVATLVGAQLYVILSDVEGLYTASPDKDPAARLIPRVDNIRKLTADVGGAGSSYGTGGMATKVRAARAALAAGIPTTICMGRRPQVLLEACRGGAVGTRFEAPAEATHETGRKLWIGLAEVVRGSITLDDGAVRAVLDKGASILPVGVVATQGDYAAGDVINVLDREGRVIGRGVARYSSDDMRRVRGLKLEVVARFLDAARVQPAVHRDELLVF